MEVGRDTFRSVSKKMHNAAKLFEKDAPLFILKKQGRTQQFYDAVQRQGKVRNARKRIAHIQKDLYRTKNSVRRMRQIITNENAPIQRYKTKIIY